MNQQEYPYAVDCAWIASDGQGFVGVFITAGEGPVPAHALRGDFFPIEEVEARVLHLTPVPISRWRSGACSYTTGPISRVSKGH